MIRTWYYILWGWELSLWLEQNFVCTFWLPKRRCQSLIIVSFYFQAYSCKTDSKPGTQGCSTSATWPRQLPPFSQCIFKQDFQAKMSSHPFLFQGLYPRRKAKASSKFVIVCPSFAFLAKEIANLEFQEFLHWATETGGFSYLRVIFILQGSCWRPPEKTL